MAKNGRPLPKIFYDSLIICNKIKVFLKSIDHSVSFDRKTPLKTAIILINFLDLKIIVHRQKISIIKIILI